MSQIQSSTPAIQLTLLQQLLNGTNNLTFTQPNDSINAMLDRIRFSEGSSVGQLCNNFMSIAIDATTICLTQLRQIYHYLSYRDAWSW